MQGIEESGHFEAHLRDLERLLELDPAAILPSHGDPEVLAGGGYGPSLTTATQDYIRLLQRMAAEPELGNYRWASCSPRVSRPGPAVLPALRARPPREREDGF